MPDTSAIRNALDLGPISGASERTVDITTVGAQSGRPRRIEIWFHQIESRWYITGVPPRKRGWYRNLEANPRFTFHLKHGVEADLGATAGPVIDVNERRQILGRIVDGLNDPSNPAGIADAPPLEDWVEFSPLVEITFDDFESGSR
jgi:hypothetical protein